MDIWKGAGSRLAVQASKCSNQQDACNCLLEMEALHSSMFPDHKNPWSSHRKGGCVVDPLYLVPRDRVLRSILWPSHHEQSSSKHMFISYRS